MIYVQITGVQNQRTVVLKIFALGDIYVCRIKGNICIGHTVVQYNFRILIAYQIHVIAVTRDFVIYLNC